MVRLYMDENVHGVITRGIRKRGVDVLTVQEDGYGGRDDPDVVDRATSLGRVLFSQDEDLLDQLDQGKQEALAELQRCSIGHQVSFPGVTVVASGLR
jgi:predicted nuclease of predicted toxin-antitoxin system